MVEARKTLYLGELEAGEFYRGDEPSWSKAKPVNIEATKVDDPYRDVEPSSTSAKQIDLAAMELEDHLLWCRAVCPISAECGTCNVSRGSVLERRPSPKVPYMPQV